MDALFIGHSYIDVTFITDFVPTGDTKALGKDYAFGIGGNAMVAGFAFAKLGKSKSLRPNMIIPIAPDFLGDMMLRKCADYGIGLFPRRVAKSSLSLVLPNDGKRAIVRCRDDDYLEPAPQLVLDPSTKCVHIDGHQPEAAFYYVKQAKEKGILTSFDGGTVRENTMELLPFIDIAVVSELFCEKLGKTPEETVLWLRKQGTIVSGVTLGDKGMIYAAPETDWQVTQLPAFPVTQVADSTGAGDIFHGAYLYSYCNNPEGSWKEHFTFASAASSLSVQKLGTEASIPDLAEIEALLPQD